jgi:hypothetical protein
MPLSKKIKIGRDQNQNRSGEKKIFSRALFCGNDAWLTGN